MQTPDQIFWDIVEREGRKYHVSDQPTGAGGISLRYARRVGLDMDGDGDTDIADLRLVTPADAVQLYRQDFFTGPGIDRLPQRLHGPMVDFAVHSGPPRAIGALQEVLEDARQLLGLPYPVIEQDGVLGPKTTRAAHVAAAALEELLVDSLQDLRAEFLLSLSPPGSKNARFRDGWLRRCAEFRSAQPDWLPERFR